MSDRPLRRNGLSRRMSVSKRFVATLAVVGLCSLPTLLWRPSASLAWGGGGASPDVEVVADALRNAMDELKPLQRQVDAGKIVGGFGKKASRIIDDAAVEGANLEEALDGALEALFLRQLALLRDEILERYSGSSSRADAVVERAEKEFVRRAEGLLRPGSSWSVEVDRELLRSSLEGTLQREEALQAERRRVSLTRRTYFKLLGQMQKQLDALGESLRGTGGASPWMVWTSYRIPKTPVLVHGRYQPGRTNVQLSLAAEEDPANAEASFVQGWRPEWLPATNLGVSVDFGF